jgi:hypothetical protein
MEAAGIEPDAQSSVNRGGDNQSGAKFGALGAQMAPSDPDQARVVEAWPTLPGPFRAGIPVVRGTIRATQRNQWATWQ